MGGPIERDALWEGVVTVVENVLVGPSATLRLRAGTRVIFPNGGGAAPYDRWGAAGPTPMGEPGCRHISVLGAVELDGAESGPVVFEGPGFGGILLLHRARLRARRATFSAAAGYAVQCADFSAADLADCRAIGGRGALRCGGFGRASLRRTRLSGLAQPAVRAGDDSVVRVSDCDFAENDTALAADGLARVRARSCRFSDNRRGADVSGRARLAGAGNEWRRHEAAASAHADAAVDLEGDRFLDNRTAWETLGRAEGAARSCLFERNATAVWLHQSARFRGRDLDLRGNAVGLRAGHDSELTLSRSRVDGPREAAIQRVDRARASLDEVSFAPGGGAGPAGPR